jgi:hypothetical protein
LFKKLFSNKQTCTEADVANLGLQFAMAFGKSWQVPIQERLSKKYPELSENELNGYNLLCQSAMNAAYEIVYTMMENNGKDLDIDEFKAVYIEAYPWVTSKNIKGLFNQGMYYAEKELRTKGEAPFNPQ